MIHEIGRELDAALRAKGCPFPVKDREAFKPTSHRNVIVIEHDGSDSFAEPRSQSNTPKRYYVRNVSAKLTIYAQSTLAGANEFEHRRLAEHVLDIALVELRRVCNARRMLPALGAGSFVDVDDLEKSERRAGAVYEVRFFVARAVEERDWDGSLAGTFTIESDALTAPYVSQAHAPDDDDDESTPPATAEPV